jgi:hypothetical protein
VHIAKLKHSSSGYQSPNLVSAGSYYEDVSE